MKLTKTNFRTGLLGLVLIASMQSAFAADIYLSNKDNPNYPKTFDTLDKSETFDKNGCQITISGEIKPGDLEKLKSLYSTGINADESGELPGVGPSICLTGPGGSLAEAIKMAKYIKDNNGATIIPPSENCESACAVVFMAGNQDSIPDRSIYPTSRLGFHAPELILPGSTYKAEEVSRAYDLAIKTMSYVSALEIMPAFTLTLLSSTPNSEMRYITTVQDAQRSLISIRGFSQLPKISAVNFAKNACTYVYKKENFNRDPVFRDQIYNTPKNDAGSISLAKVSYSSDIELKSKSLIWIGEESFSDCKVSVRVAVDDLNIRGVQVNFSDREEEVDLLSLWPPEMRIADMSKNVMTKAELQNLSKSSSLNRCQSLHFKRKIRRSNQGTKLCKYPHRCIVTSTYCYYRQTGCAGTNSRA